ncbi:MAG TPA: SUMF1/EgtB/PvdO family nonheme iron enzyme [Xanthobacteraceae bacterium]|nr:SUMF1/EgtB/PvdO family nonheme iron enzyme [Xanthobacteraceae bacterium]
MSSLTDLPELVGFFSYSREDDDDSHGALTALRERIQRELRGQLGRSMKTFRLWQDKEAIAPGTLWAAEIKTAVAQAVFFIPIITPTVVRSPYCKFELESFLAREAELGRSDLVFPILYIRVPELEDSARQQNDPVLSIIAKRQYLDWREFRHRDVQSTDVKEAVERFCAKICEALHRSWLSREEREKQQEIAALQQAEAERACREAEAKRSAEEAASQRAKAVENRRRDEEARKQAAELQALRRSEEDRREQEAALIRQRADAERLHSELQAKRQTEEQERRRKGSTRAGVVGLLIGASILGAIGFWLVNAPQVSVSPLATAPPATSPAPTAAASGDVFALSAERERALKPKDTFKECWNYCPEMVVIPAGAFTMGSPASEQVRSSNEGPQHRVTFANPFAVGIFALTFDEWDACVADGGCNGYKPDDQDWGRGRLPVIDVSWDDAEAYVAWVSKKTGKSYRLLSEAEREYVTRAGTTTPFWWGSSISTSQANYNGNYTYGNGVKGEYRARTVQVGSFAPNPWGLYQVHGNVWDWTEDCYHDSYNGAPADGSAWTGGDCGSRVIRGGSWFHGPNSLRSANRSGLSTGGRYGELGFRVARTLLAP